MNSFGDFLYTLRKEKGMTQAELAEQLGVTNKAVSKWETGEAMPETALLLPIARIFGVSVDELLDGKRSGQSDEVNSGQTDNVISNDHIGDYLFKRGREDRENRTLLEKIQGAVCTTIVFAGIIAYFLLGILGGLWHPYWVIIPVCALSSGLVGTVFDACNIKKREAKIARGENPYTGAICGSIMLLCISTYLLLGALMNLWHPMWIIIVVGAFACGIIAMFAEIINHKKK